jgi:hypothetical protein
MSFKEKAETAGDRDEAESPQVSWFRKQFPHFFSQKVETARNGSTHLFREERNTKRSIIRKLGEKTTTFVDLHMDPGDRSFAFKLGAGIKLPVSRETLVNATSVGSGGEWVRIKVGTEVLRLKRADLRKAFHELEEEQSN